MSEMIRIIGIDPGIRNTGWGVLESCKHKLSWIDHGVVSPPPDAPMVERIGTIYVGIEAVISQYNPELAALETVFVHKNSASALKLGQARGASLAALGVLKVPVMEFSPRSVKQSVTGTGSADKAQIGYMIRMLLPGSGEPDLDAADALAIAITAANHRATNRAGAA